MKKILFIWRGPSPYRVDFFNELGKLTELTVLFEMSPDDIKDKNKGWFHEDYNNFKAIYLKKLNLGRLSFCYGILPYLLKANKYDYVVLGMYSTITEAFAISIMKLLSKKYYLNSDGGFIKKDSFFTKKLKRFLIGGAYGYLASSEGTVSYLKHYGAKSNIHVYPFTSSMAKDVVKNITIIDKERAKTELFRTTNVVVLFTGQFIYRKGIDVLIRACSHLKTKCDIFIVGGKPTKEMNQYISEKYLSNIHFVDFVKPSELGKYYLASDIYVLPTREDIWGLVINEAMSYGLPVITTNKCLAGLELIKNGDNGFIIDSDNELALGKAIDKLAISAELRNKISQNNKQKISRYSIEEMAKVHALVFEEN